MGNLNDVEQRIIDCVMDYFAMRQKHQSAWDLESDLRKLAEDLSLQRAVANARRFQGDAT